MRKFIISDIHGFGNVYYSMMSYLDNISKNSEIELYLNGDLIDRGYESAEILLDVKKRVLENKYKITYLGGNHELMMHKVFEKRKKGSYISPFEDWFNNGGYVTDYGLEEKLENDPHKILEVANFISNLKIYHKFQEKIGGKEIVLVHAACPSCVNDDCNMYIKNNNISVFNAVWTRENELSFLGFDLPLKKVGNEKYFTIIGHTPVNNKYGFEYHKNQNYLNIDGGCAGYTIGEFKYNHFPLVEVCDDFLKILTFNSNNEIVYGNYFDGKRIIPYQEEELEEARKYLDMSVLIKKLAINEDGIVYYK